jgi:hypothetical protein
MRRGLTLASIAIALALLADSAAQPVDPGQEGELKAFLPPQHGGRVCYTRRYSAEHLAKHPKQTVAEMEFRLTYYQHEPDQSWPEGQRNYYFALTAKVKGKARRLKAFGECTPVTGAISCGVECDGGGVLVMRRPDDKALVYFPDAQSFIRMTEGCDETEDDRFELKPGSDDWEFLLGKSADAACPEYEDW